MYTVAARNDTIRATLDRFNAGGIPLTVIDIPDTAQRNVAVRLETEQRGVVALTFDAHGGLITVSFNGELYLSRRLDVTAVQLTEAAGDERARLLDRVLVETQRSLDHCERTYPFFSLSRVVIGPFAGDAALRAHLAANLYLPVEGLELEPGRAPAGGGARLEHRPAGALAEADRRRLARGEEGAMSQQINLYSPIFRKQTKVFSATTMLQGLGLIVLVIAVFYYYMSAAELAARAARSGVRAAAEKRARAAQGVRRARVARRARQAARRAQEGAGSRARRPRGRRWKA